MLERLGRGCARHHRIVLILWVALAVLLVIVQGAAGGRTRDVFTIPGTDSQAAIDLLQQRFPTENLPAATVVYQAQSGTLRDGTHQTEIESAVARMQKLPKVKSVGNPFATGAAAIGGRISPDGTIATITVTYNATIGELNDGVYSSLTAAAKVPGVNVQFGGVVTDLFNQAINSGISKYSDEIGLLIAVIIILFAFGSVIAMGLPLGTALFGLAVAISSMMALASIFTIGTVAPILGTMIGLGVGIDYSLFVVTRYRQNLADGQDVETAVGVAIGTAGAAVLFAGLTVCLALVGLAITGIPYVATLGYTAALVVGVMVIAALTLLPALLGLVGRRIDKWRVPGMGGKPVGTGSSAAAVAANDPTSADAKGWARWAEMIAKRPIIYALSSLIALLVLASPVLSMHLGFIDDGNQPTSLTQRQAYDLVTQGFGPGANGPLLVAIALPKPTATNAKPDITAALTLASRIQHTANVASVQGPLPSPTGNAAIIIVNPKTAPGAPETQTLVRTLRADVIPSAVHGTSISAVNVHVGGQTAELIDLTDRIESRLVLFIGIVVLGAFLLLVLVFRSIAVPLKAAIMNLLSIGAAYGVVVAVFQWGWLKSLIGLQQTIPIEAFIPLMMFAILFGLSMDYEVFLMSRIRESYLKTGQSRASVGIGLTATARVITSAALIMISVFLSFVTNPQPTVKMLGLGLAVAVFVDATLVRLILVPATMELLGKANWWFPKWLEWLPTIDLEGTGAVKADAATATSAPTREPVGSAS
jgi:RND superfamily putative drug exporter